VNGSATTAARKEGASMDAERDVRRQYRNELKFRLCLAHHPSLIIQLCRH
jgi:hypothetical protein